MAEIESEDVDLEPVKNELPCEPTIDGRNVEDAEKRQKIQRLLEDALIATGLEELVITGREEKRDEKERERAAGEESLQPKDETSDKEASTRLQGEAEADKQKPHPLDLIPKTEWLDITKGFSEAAQQLGPGELTQEVNFSLFDAMSAIELMDPKMDASVQWGRFASYPKTIQEVRELSILKMDGHTAEELVGIMDEVFACVVTWLEGHTLAQTVFTSLYLLDTNGIENLCLRAFSQGVIKTVESMRECICRAGVYSEDEQQGVCFGFDMLSSMSDSTVTASLKEAEEKAMGLLRHCDEGESNSKCRTSSAASVEVLKALAARLKFSRLLFALVTAMRKATVQGIEAGIQKLSSCLTTFDDVIQTVDLGTKLDSENPLSLGFHPVINQRLLPPSYKPYSILPRANGLRILQTILTDLQKVFEIGRIDSFRDLLDAIVAFGAVPRSKNVLVRSLVILLCLQSDRHKLFGSPTVDSLLREDSRIMCNPPSLNPRSPISSSSQGKEMADRYFGQALTPMTELLKMYCQHRSRQRQKIPRCLELFADLQQESERADHSLNDLVLKLDPQRQHLACFSTWILYYIVQLMVEYVLLGFEHKLYSPFEMHYMYWYLEYLYGWQHTALRSAGRLLSADPIVPGKGKRKTKKKREVPKGRERVTAVVQAKRLACVGIMRALEGMLLDQKIPQPNFQLGYGSLELCYKHRFLPLVSLSVPQPLSYLDYLRLAGIGNYRFRSQDLNLYGTAAKHFESTKTAVESIPHPTEDLESLLKVAKTNLVVMNLAAKGHKKDSRLPPTFDYSAHQHFAILRLN